MKIYIPHINLSPLSLQNISKYFINENMLHYIYSSEGIFEINNDVIYKKIIHDDTNINMNIDGNEICIDNSKFSKGFIVNQLPFNHIYKPINRKKYSLREKCKLQLIVDIEDKCVKDFYLLTNETIITHSLSEDILTFLSVLK